jgi:hypothetical protein
LEQQSQAWDDTWQAPSGCNCSGINPIQSPIIDLVELKQPHPIGNIFSFYSFIEQGFWGMAKQGPTLGRDECFKITCWILFIASKIVCVVLVFLFQPLEVFIFL